jgi:hypothetical protein
MEDKKWFILHNDKVQGPFTISTIDNKFEKQLREESKFWARGQPQWITAPQLRDELKKESENILTANQKNAERLWKVMDNKVELQPMTYDDLLILLKSKNDLAHIRIWTEGYKEWQDVYQIEKILDQLGVNRRQHPRVPIKGSIYFETQNGANHEAELSMISHGGFGLENTHSITIGERIKGTITSSSLPMTIYCAAEVVFLNNSGFVGFRFLNISTEGKSSIIAYVKQFIDQHPDESFTKMS